MDIGGLLRQSREERGISLQTLARTTRVQLRILAAVERNDLSSMPPGPFARGFVRAYAREVGLDPDRTAGEYFAQFDDRATFPPHVPEPPASAPFSEPATTQWLWPVAGLVVATLAIVSLFDIGTAPSPPVTAPAAVGTSGRVSPTPTATTESPAPAPASDAAPAVARPAALLVTLTASAPSWVEAYVDGQRVLYRIINPGERQELRANDAIKLRAGDAGALTWTINDRRAGPMGAPGQVRDVTVTRQNASAIH